MSEGKIKATTIMKSERAVALFQEILNHLREGGVHFEQNGRSMEMITGEAVEMEIKAKHKDGKHKLEFELVWKDELNSGEISEGDLSGLKVSSKNTRSSRTEMSHEHAHRQMANKHVSNEDLQEQMPVEAAVF
ncbi:MAG: amphi-Trp domain-containing protein [Desulfomonilaceae bacterium]